MQNFLRRYFRHNPPYVIAEIGINHNGSLQLAGDLIRIAKQVGADAVKFQCFQAADLASEDNLKASYISTAGIKESLKSFFQRIALSRSAFRILKEEADRIGITFFASPFSTAWVKFLNEIDVPFFKVASRELTNLPLLSAMARTGKPLFLSTGMANENEIAQAIKTVRMSKNHQIVLFHCVSAYPTPPSQVNLLSIPYLATQYPFPVGFSDHTAGTTIALAALSLGAQCIEKHFTLSKSLPGPDHALSLEPEEFSQLVQAGKIIWQARGQVGKKLMSCEKETKLMARRSIVARKQLLRNTCIKKAHLSFSPPENGIPPSSLDQVLGKKTKRMIKEGQPITWEDLK